MPVTLRLQHALEFLKGLVETQTAGPSRRVSDSVSLGRAWESALLTSSQLVQVLLVQGPHVENYCSRGSFTYFPSAASYAL